MISDFQQRKLRVTNLISSYLEFRGMCVGFLAHLPDALQHNEYSAIVNLVNDDKLEVSVLGAIIEVYFDYIIVNDNMLGAIKCDEILSPEKERRTLVANYFDWEGRAFLTPDGDKPIQGLHNRYYPGTLLFQICEALLAHHVINKSETNDA